MSKSVEIPPQQKELTADRKRRRTDSSSPQGRSVKFSHHDILRDCVPTSKKESVVVEVIVNSFTLIDF